MKIYNSPVAPNPRRVRIFLAEKDIKVPFEDIDIGRFRIGVRHKKETRVLSCGTMVAVQRRPK